MDALSEANEEAQISRLLMAADSASGKGDYSKALKCIVEALEIDGTNSEALSRRVTCYLQMYDFLSAENDADKMIALKPGDPRGHLARGLVLQHISHHREALSCYLKALELSYTPADEISGLLVQLCVALQCSPSSFVINVKGMHYYDQVAEVGIAFLHGNQPLLALEVLQTALKLKMSQPEATVMRINLAIGHAYSALKHYTNALQCYQDCLDIATSCGDVKHRVKSLVNIASMHSEIGDNYKAIVRYEMLLDLHQQMESLETAQESVEERVINDLESIDAFSPALVASIYMNASVAYKAIGNASRALHFAQVYFAVYRGKGNDSETLSHYRHLGSLYELVKDYPNAMHFYKHYLMLSKSYESRRDVAFAYGCLGKLNGLLRFWPLAIVQHERHVTIAERLRDRAACLLAYEMYGDTLMLCKDYSSAAVAYGQMARFCERNVFAAATAWCKLGNSHYSLTHNQRALHYFETALRVAREEHVQMRLDAQYGAACCLQKAMDVADLEKGRKHFNDLITALRKQIDQVKEETRMSPKGLLLRLSSCYDGMQLVLSKLGNDVECLLHAECMRLLLASQSLHDKVVIHSRLPAPPTISNLMAPLHNQSSTVVYYSLLGEVLLIWLLVPLKGLVRFYVRRPEEKVPVARQLEALLGQILKTASQEKYTYNCDRRNLSTVNAVIDAETRSTAYDSLKHVPQVETNGHFPGRSHAALEKTLYKLLLGPVDDIIQKLDMGSTLVIIPDKALKLCPFPFLRDLRGNRIMDRYRITYLPGLFALDLINKNEVRQLQEEDDLNLLKMKSRIGGLYKQFTSSSLVYSADSNTRDTTVSADAYRLNKTSNPRLLSRHRESLETAAFQAVAEAPNHNASPMEGTAFLQKLPTDARLLSRKKSQSEDTFFCISLAEVSRRAVATRRTVNNFSVAPPVPEPSTNRRLRCSVGASCDVHRLLGSREMSTLITRTSTGTDCISSPSSIPRYYQVSSRDRCLVFGNPKLIRGSMVLRTRTWYAPRTSPPCQTELNTVSSVLKCDPVSGDLATKRLFLDELSEATIVHIASYMDLREGQMALAADVSCFTKDALIDERHYIVTCEEIMRVTSRAKLVVLSGGSSDPRRLLDLPGSCLNELFQLATAFIAAGAQSVLLFPVSQPAPIVEAFFLNFYMQFSEGCHVSQALRAGIKSVTDSVHASSIAIFSCMHIGKDVFIDSLDIKNAMLDQAVDVVEEIACRQTKRPLLNLSVDSGVQGLAGQLLSMQEVLADVIARESAELRILEELVNLVKAALKVVRCKGRRTRAHYLSEQADCAPARQLLRLAGFEFQDSSLVSTRMRPVVMLPHWDPDGLLERSLSILMSAREACLYSPEMRTALHEALPLDQVAISHMVDMLALTKHSPGAQLQVTDKAIANLWNIDKCRFLLLRMGFIQIGTIIHFNRTTENMDLLDASLRLMIMMCVHKSAVLIAKLDIKELGPPPFTSTDSDVDGNSGKLPTMLPVVLPQGELRLRVPWASRLETPAEMDEKAKLAKKQSQIRRQYVTERRELSELHGNLNAGQAAEVLKSIGSPMRKTRNIKVLANSTVSRDRIPFTYAPPLSGSQLEYRREYSHSLLKERLANTLQHEKHDKARPLRAYADVMR